MAYHVKVVGLGDAVSELEDLVGGELDDSSAPTADHVVVGLFSECELEVGPFQVEQHPLEDSAVDQERQCSVDCRLPDGSASFFEEIGDLISLEVAFETEDGVEDLQTRVRYLDAMAPQVATECLA